MNDDRDFHVGQTVFYFDGSRSNRQTPATVTRIGRKYVYAKVHGREKPFDLETGRGPIQTGYGEWIRTREQVEESRLRDDALARVKPLRDPYSGAWRSLSVDQINRIADITEEGRA